APAEAAPTAGTVAAGHAHHPQAVPLRLPDKHLKQHRRPVPAGMVAGTATAVVPLPPGRTGTGTRRIRSAPTPPPRRAPPPRGGTAPHRHRTVRHLPVLRPRAATRPAARGTRARRVRRMRARAGTRNLTSGPPAGNRAGRRPYPY